MFLQTLGNKLWKLSAKQLKDLVHTSYPGIFQKRGNKQVRLENQNFMLNKTEIILSHQYNIWKKYWSMFLLKIIC